MPERNHAASTPDIAPPLKVFGPTYTGESSQSAPADNSASDDIRLLNEETSTGMVLHPLNAGQDIRQTSPVAGEHRMGKLPAIVISRYGIHMDSLASEQKQALMSGFQLPAAESDSGPVISLNGYRYIQLDTHTVACVRWDENNNSWRLIQQGGTEAQPGYPVRWNTGSWVLNNHIGLPGGHGETDTRFAELVSILLVYGADGDRLREAFSQFITTASLLARKKGLVPLIEEILQHIGWERASTLVHEHLSWFSAHIKKPGNVLLKVLMKHLSGNPLVQGFRYFIEGGMELRIGRSTIRNFFRRISLEDAVALIKTYPDWFRSRENEDRDVLISRILWKSFDAATTREYFAQLIQHDLLHGFEHKSIQTLFIILGATEAVSLIRQYPDWFRVAVAQVNLPWEGILLRHIFNPAFIELVDEFAQAGFLQAKSASLLRQLGEHYHGPETLMLVLQLATQNVPLIELPLFGSSLLYSGFLDVLTPWWNAQRKTLTNALTGLTEAIEEGNFRLSIQGAHGVAEVLRQLPKPRLLAARSLLESAMKQLDAFVQHLVPLSWRQLAPFVTDQYEIRITTLEGNIAAAVREGFMVHQHNGSAGNTVLFQGTHYLQTGLDTVVRLRYDDNGIWRMMPSEEHDDRPHPGFPVLQLPDGSWQPNFSAGLPGGNQNFIFADAVARYAIQMSDLPAEKEQALNSAFLALESADGALISPVVTLDGEYYLQIDKDTVAPVRWDKDSNVWRLIQREEPAMKPGLPVRWNGRIWVVSNETGLPGGFGEAGAHAQVSTLLNAMLTEVPYGDELKREFSQCITSSIGLSDKQTLFKFIEILLAHTAHVSALKEVLNQRMLSDPMISARSILVRLIEKMLQRIGSQGAEVLLNEHLAWFSVYVERPGDLLFLAFAGHFSGSLLIQHCRQFIENPQLSISRELVARLFWNTRLNDVVMLAKTFPDWFRSRHPEDQRIVIKRILMNAFDSGIVRQHFSQLIQYGLLGSMTQPEIQMLFRLLNNSDATALIREYPQWFRAAAGTVSIPWEDVLLWHITDPGFIDLLDNFVEADFLQERSADLLRQLAEHYKEPEAFALLLQLAVQNQPLYPLTHARYIVMKGAQSGFVDVLTPQEHPLRDALTQALEGLTGTIQTGYCQASIQKAHGLAVILSQLPGHPLSNDVLEQLDTFVQHLLPFSWRHLFIEERKQYEIPVASLGASVAKSLQAGFLEHQRNGMAGSYVAIEEGGEGRYYIQTGLHTVARICWGEPMRTWRLPSGNQFSRGFPVFQNIYGVWLPNFAIGLPGGNRDFVTAQGNPREDIRVINNNKIITSEQARQARQILVSLQTAESMRGVSLAEKDRLADLFSSIDRDADAVIARLATDSAAQRTCNDELLYFSQLSPLRQEQLRVRGLEWNDVPRVSAAMEMRQIARLQALSIVAGREKAHMTLIPQSLYLDIPGEKARTGANALGFARLLLNSTADISGNGDEHKRFMLLDNDIRLRTALGMASAQEQLDADNARQQLITLSHEQGIWDPIQHTLDEVLQGEEAGYYRLKSASLVLFLEQHPDELRFYLPGSGAVLSFLRQEYESPAALRTRAAYLLDNYLRQTSPAWQGELADTLGIKRDAAGLVQFQLSRFNQQKVQDCAAATDFLEQARVFTSERERLYQRAPLQAEGQVLPWVELVDMGMYYQGSPLDATTNPLTLQEWRLNHGLFSQYLSDLNQLATQNKDSLLARIANKKLDQLGALLEGPLRAAGDDFLKQTARPAGELKRALREVINPVLDIRIQVMMLMGLISDIQALQNGKMATMNEEEKIFRFARISLTTLSLAPVLVSLGVQGSLHLAGKMGVMEALEKTLTASAHPLSRAVLADLSLQEASVLRALMQQSVRGINLAMKGLGGLSRFAGRGFMLLSALDVAMNARALKQENDAFKREQLETELMFDSTSLGLMITGEMGMALGADMPWLMPAFFVVEKIHTLVTGVQQARRQLQQAAQVLTLSWQEKLQVWADALNGYRDWAADLQVFQALGLTLAEKTLLPQVRQYREAHKNLLSADQVYEESALPDLRCRWRVLRGMSGQVMEIWEFNLTSMMAFLQEKGITSARQSSIQDLLEKVNRADLDDKARRVQLNVLFSKLQLDHSELGLIRLPLSAPEPGYIALSGPFDADAPTLEWSSAADFWYGFKKAFSGGYNEKPDDMKYYSLHWYLDDPDIFSSVRYDFPAGAEVIELDANQPDRSLPAGVILRVPERDELSSASLLASAGRPETLAIQVNTSWQQPGRHFHLTGRQAAENQFHLRGLAPAKVSLTAGQRGDHFLLDSARLTGTIQGGEGEDSLKFMGTALNEREQHQYVWKAVLGSNDKPGLAGFQGEAETLQLDSIEHLVVASAIRADLHGNEKPNLLLLQQGSARGGAGQDVYIVEQQAHGQQATSVILEEEEEGDAFSQLKLTTTATTQRLTGCRLQEAQAGQ